MLIKLDVLKQDIIDAAATYKSAVPCPNKDLMITINVPLEILTSHLQDHHTHSSMALNINVSLKAEASIKTRHFQKAKNRLTNIVTPPTQGGSCATTSSSDVHIAYKMTMNPTNYPPYDVYFSTQTKK